MQVNDKEAKKFVAVCPLAKQSKRIYDLASGNHEMYMRRRRPDTLEVQQMKSQKAELMEAKVRERAVLNREMAARARAEQQRLELEERVKEMEARAAKRDKELEEANENIRRLEEQLRELREAKERLEAEQDKLTEMLRQLEEDKGLEAAERARMEEEVSTRTYKPTTHNLAYFSQHCSNHSDNSGDIIPHIHPIYHLVTAHLYSLATTFMTS